MIFIELRDGTGFLQAVLTGQLCQSYEALILQPESSVTLFGTLVAVKEGQKAEGGQPEAPKLRNLVCGKERMGQYHAPGHEEEPRGGRGGTCPQTEAPSRVQKGARVTIAKARAPIA